MDSEFSCLNGDSTVFVEINYSYNGNGLNFYRKGNICFFKIGTLQGIPRGVFILCNPGSVPVEYRPAYAFSFSTIATNSGSIKRYSFSIETDGSVTGYNYGEYNGPENFGDTFTYIAN